ncbi:MAG: hypothetical protein WC310_05535 [Patescibacteria group bacterium]
MAIFARRILCGSYRLLRQSHSQSGAQVQQCTHTLGSHEQAVFSSSGMPQSHFFSDITFKLVGYTIFIFPLREQKVKAEHE